MNELINEFLKDYGDEVYDMPDSALELLMDDHICVSWLGVEYFIPENNSMYSDVDGLIYELLSGCYIV